MTGHGALAAGTKKGGMESDQQQGVGDQCGRSRSRKNALGGKGLKHFEQRKTNKDKKKGGNKGKAKHNQE